MTLARNLLNKYITLKQNIIVFVITTVFGRGTVNKVGAMVLTETKIVPSLTWAPKRIGPPKYEPTGDFFPKKKRNRVFSDRFEFCEKKKKKKTVEPKFRET